MVRKEEKPLMTVNVDVTVWIDVSYLLYASFCQEVDVQRYKFSSMEIL